MTRRLTFAVLATIALALTYALAPTGRPLAFAIDGDLTRATQILVFLHGRGGSLARAEPFAGELRRAGLPAEVAVVSFEAPYPFHFGWSWGDTAEKQASSRSRLRTQIAALAGARRVVVAGFSEGAGVAIDWAAEDPRVSGLASFSPCYSHLRGELPKREGLRVLLAHGTNDPVCPIEESRSLARVLEAAKRPVRYVEFTGPHTIAPEALRALVTLTCESCAFP